MAADGAWGKSDVRRMGGRDVDEGACEARFQKVAAISVAATGPELRADRPGGRNARRVSRLWAPVSGVTKRRLEGDADLSQRPRQPDADPLRKVRFREAARDIVARDRNDRKYGLAVDTARAIARAMERAAPPRISRRPVGTASGDKRAPRRRRCAGLGDDPAEAAERVLDHVPVRSGPGEATGTLRPPGSRAHRAVHPGMAPRSVRRPI